jgi:hypothetical protein
LQVFGRLLWAAKAMSLSGTQSQTQTNDAWSIAMGQGERPNGKQLGKSEDHGGQIHGPANKFFGGVCYKRSPMLVETQAL